MVGPRRSACALAVAGLLLAPVVARAHEPAAPTGAGLRTSTPSLAVIRAAPDFTLRDVDGQPMQLSDLRGHVVLLAFVYTKCPAACPLVTQRMALLQQRLVRARAFPARVNLLSVTVDPERDTPAVLAHYAQAFSADPNGWHFLREEPQRLRPVLAAWDEWTQPLPGGEIDHPARIHLIDARGRVREIYSLALFDERQAFLDIQALLRERS